MQLAERLFQSFAPLNEKHLLPFSVPLFDNLRPVDVLRNLYEVLCEFFLNKLRKYGGASSFKPGGGARNFPTGAESSNEGTKIWFSGYYKCQRSVGNWPPNSRYTERFSSE